VGKHVYIKFIPKRRILSLGICAHLPHNCGGPFDILAKVGVVACHRSSGLLASTDNPHKIA